MSNLDAPVTRLRLAVGLPAYGDALTAHQARMWMEFGSILGGSIERFELVMFMHIDVNPIDKARNLLVTNAIKHKADWLLMIDDDTWVESNTADDDAGTMLLRMISDADRRGAAVVCAPVVRRRMLHGDRDEYMVYRQREDSIKPDKLESLSYTNEKDCADLNSRHLFAIDACATACIAISLKRFTFLADPFWFDRELQLSEDLLFCHRVRENGGEIYCDPRVRTGHKSRPFGIYSR